MSVAVHDQPGRLELSNRMGYATLMPTAMACLLVGIVWTVAVIFIVPEEWISLATIVPDGLAAIYLSLAALWNRSRATITGDTLEWGTGPVPVPGYPLRRTLPSGQIASIFVSPCAVANRYAKTYIHTFDIWVLSATGAAERLVSRIDTVAAAREWAALMERRLNLAPGRVTPALASPTRPVSEDPDLIASGKPLALFCAFAIFAGLMVAASPWLRTLGKTEADGTIMRFDTEWVQGSKRGYTRRNCSVGFVTPQGEERARVSEDCPQSAKLGDHLAVFYDPAQPKRAMARGYWRSWFGLIFLVPGMAGLAYALVTARRAQRDANTLAEDRFESLDPFWDLTASNATVDNGVLELRSPPGTALSPVLCRQAYGSHSIALKVTAQAGESRVQTAGIVFWADGFGHGYAFTVVPAQRSVEAWRKVSDQWQRVLPLTPLLPVVTAHGEWNTLQVVARGNQADLSINGAHAASVQGTPPPGGSLAGIFADFSKDTVWHFSDFRVTAVSTPADQR